MIVKKIPAHRDKRHVGVRRAKHVRDLVDYMRSPEKESPLREHLVAYMASQGLSDGPERLIHIGARNFVSVDLEGQRAEMMAVAQAAVRTTNPIDHWLLSWREGEIPTAQQVDEAVELFVDRLGMANHQVIYAVHGDTHNRHCHIALNRYDPIIRKVITIHKGYWREASHRAVAEIVARFGWEAEPNARYEWIDGAAEMSAAALARVNEGVKPLRAGASMIEIQTGYRSAQRIAQDEAWPIIREASSWDQIHAGLACRGMTYDPVGTNGAILKVGKAGVKASDVSRYASIKKLEGRLGSFQPRPAGLKVSPREQSDRFAGAFRADEFRQQTLTWKNASPEERKKGNLVRPPENLETFLHQHGEHHSAESWRQGNRDLVGIPIFEAAHQPAHAFVDRVGDYIGERCAEGMRYARKGEGTAFIDMGTKIAVLPCSDEALLAALQLAVQRFDGRVRVIGDDAMQQRVWKLAIKHGLHGSLASHPPDGVQLPRTDPVVTSVTASTDVGTDRPAPIGPPEEREVRRSLSEQQRGGGIVAQAQALRHSSASANARSQRPANTDSAQKPIAEVAVTSVTERRGGIVDQARSIALQGDGPLNDKDARPPEGSDFPGGRVRGVRPRSIAKGPNDLRPAQPFPPSKDRGR